MKNIYNRLYFKINLLKKAISTIASASFRIVGSVGITVTISTNAQKSSLLLNKIRTLLLMKSYENFLLDCCCSRRRVGACELVCCHPLNVIKIITSKKLLVISFVVHSWFCQSELRFCQIKVNLLAGHLEMTGKQINLNLKTVKQTGY